MEQISHTTPWQLGLEIKINQIGQRLCNLQLSTLGERVSTAASDSCSRVMGVEPDVVFCFCSTFTFVNVVCSEMLFCSL